MGERILFEVAWWLLFATAVGLCAGSFLNVVIYRLPRGRSLRSPRWSACPACRHPIRWYDNLPILSFIRLRGRCRDCAIPISSRYPVVEACTALIVLVLMDAFFVGQIRTGIGESPAGFTDQLAADWPILLAHFILFAALFAMSAIDLEHYWVDIRFTNLATVVGFAAHTLWTPYHSMDRTPWIRPSDSLALFSLLALAGIGLVWLVSICQPNVDPEDFGETDEIEIDDGATLATREANKLPSWEPPPRMLVWISVVMLMALVVGLGLDKAGLASIKHAPRALLPIGMLFFLIVWESTTVRDSDTEIIEAIDEERHTARRQVVGELLLLIPALVLGGLGLWIMLGGGDVAARISESIHDPIRVPGVAMLRRWTPIYGLATAASGYIIAGALGWGVRIIFTLVFGREAFGTGDIHMMAAAGCVLGWPIVVLGFFVTCLLALIGWVMVLPFKRARAIPLGPWLSLSFLIVTVFYETLIAWPPIARPIAAASFLLGLG